MGSGKTAVNIVTSLFLILLLLTSILKPVPAKASIISAITSFFGSAQVQAQEVQPNSQNMALLQASISPNQTSSSTSDDITIVGGTSLLPDTQSLGDIKTIDDDQISLYVVHPGDTLPAIAKMFGVSVNTIRWGNDISGNTITVGQTLVILPVSGVQHIVKSGDTLKSIAKQHNGDINDIMQYNGLTLNSKLAVGDIVIVPDGVDAPSGSQSSGSSQGGVTGSPTYNNSGSPKVGSFCQNFPMYVGYYMRPVVNCIKTQGIHGHNAVDLASSYGSNIYASAEGDVILSRNSGWNGGYGSYIIIKHGNGTQTVYGHLSATLVDVGDHVTQGQVIGRMGNTGNVNGPTGVHLHFEIRGARNPF